MSDTTSPKAFLDAINSPEGLPVVKFQNGDTISIQGSTDAIAFRITAKPRIDGGSPIHLGTIVLNNSFPKITHDHLTAIADFIKANL